MLKYLLFLLISIAFSDVAAQNKRSKLLLTPDSTKVERVSPSVGWDSRVSIFNGKLISFKGVRAGVRFGKKRHRLTLSYRWFSYEEDIGLFDYKTIINPRYVTELEAFYYNLTYQHIFIDRYRYAIGTTYEIGLGAKYEKENSYGKNIHIFRRTKKFVPLQIGIYGEWKATRFVGITGNLGYRWVKNYSEQPSINKMYFGIGSRFYLGSISRYLLALRRSAT